MQGSAALQQAVTPYRHPQRLWYAVKTKPRQEELAKKNLQDQSFEIYLPYITLRKRKQGKWQQVREVLFPGYLFIHVDTADQSIAPVRSTPGVSGMVRFGTQLLPINDDLIAHIQRQERLLTDSADSAVSSFQPGDKLTILDGPFAGLTAAFSMARSSDRVMVLINILGGQKAVAVPVNSVEKA
ncbi:MAG: transcription/translation regulatory transformer protein RfaH [Porticoccaceae bacterium]|nr:transcription/translation regulatory transformer protein RfaH [Porticoccaceae bacterium]